MHRGPQVIRGLGAFLFFCLAQSRGAELWSVWDNAKALQGRRVAIALLDRTCQHGILHEWSPDSWIIEPDMQSVKDGKAVLRSAERVRILREDVLRISEWWSPPSVKDLLYNGHNSWDDVGELAPAGREHVLITTREHKEIQGQPSAFTTNSIQIDRHMIAKTDILTVDYLRQKPLTEKQQYLVHEEASFLDARLWFKRWLIPLIRVRVFDASKSEDNTPVCADN